MATLTRIADLVDGLIQAGRIYYGQTEPNMRRALQAAMAHWKTCRPGAQPAAWGAGYNEGIDTVLSVAREQLYGANVTLDTVQRCDRLLRGGWQHVLDILKCCYSGRSPYAVNAASLAEFLLAHQREKLMPLRVGGDGMDPRALAKDVKAFRWLQRFGASTSEAALIGDRIYDEELVALPPGGGHEIVEGLLALAWLRARNHAIQPELLGDNAFTVHDVCTHFHRVPSGRMRIFALLYQTYGDAEAALSVLPHVRMLQEADQMCAAISAITEAAGWRRDS